MTRRTRSTIPATPPTESEKWRVIQDCGARLMSRAGLAVQALAKQEPVCSDDESEAVRMVAMAAHALGLRVVS